MLPVNVDIENPQTSLSSLLMSMHKEKLRIKEINAEINSISLKNSQLGMIVKINIRSGMKV